MSQQAKPLTLDGKKILEAFDISIIDGVEDPVVEVQDLDPASWASESQRQYRKQTQVDFKAGGRGFVKYQGDQFVAFLHKANLEHIRIGLGSFLVVGDLLELVALAQENPEDRLLSALPFAILDDELQALRLFKDNKESLLSVEELKRLASIGLIYWVGDNQYEFTTFGLSVLNGDFNRPIEESEDTPVRYIRLGTNRRVYAVYGSSSIDCVNTLLTKVADLEALRNKAEDVLTLCRLIFDEGEVEFTVTTGNGAKSRTDKLKDLLLAVPSAITAIDEYQEKAKDTSSIGAGRESDNVAKDAARFRAEQKRAWSGDPEYSIATHFANALPLNEKDFLAARRAYIDSSVWMKV